MEVEQIQKQISTKRKRTCDYARVSSKSDEQESSLTYQIENYTKMIMTYPDYEFCGVFVRTSATSRAWIRTYL